MKDFEKNRRLRLYIFAAFFVTFEAITYASNDMIMPGMLQVVSQFNAGLSYVATSVSIFILGNTLMQLFIGPSADRYGKRLVLITGNSLFVVFTAVTAFSMSINQFMIGRLLQGTGCAFIAVGYSMIHEKFEDKSAVKLIALMGNVTILAPLVGPVIGGLIVKYSSWRYVFFIIGIASILSLFGLIRYTPPSRRILDRIEVKSITASYFSILKDRMFILGTSSICLATVPLIAWIGLAPVLIMKTAGLGFSEYIIYQLIALGGLSMSSIVMQVIAGNYSFFRIMASGNAMFIAGGLWILCFSWHPLLMTIGFFINSFGLGLFNGMTFRILMSNDKHSKSMTISLLVFIETIAMSLGLETVNLICGRCSFSFLSFAFIVFLFTASASACMYFFCRMNREKKWESG